MKLAAIPIDAEEARAFITRVHRHHRAPVGWIFHVACGTDHVCGVATVGRPVARGLDDGWTCELTRLASDGCRNVCSFLYRASWRIAREKGFRRMVTYTLASEPGTSLRAAGLREVAKVRGRSWHAPSRPRVDKHPTQDKIRWEVGTTTEDGGRDGSE